MSTSPVKVERQKIVLDDKDLVETFVKGSGPGGQCINKRSSCVDLRHIPTGVRVQCQQTRSLQENRGIARKLLREKLDDLINGDLSKNSKKAAKIAKQKSRRARRAREKYAKPAEQQEQTFSGEARTATDILRSAGSSTTGPSMDQHQQEQRRTSAGQKREMYPGLSSQRRSSADRAAEFDQQYPTGASFKKWFQ
ncbi:hypothetical protein DFQ29_009034 [Apophysomyces sp. BC1021]|nr:hypothetical protein DFQ29_009034 [Apophysomyces sp. BC1021]